MNLRNKCRELERILSAFGRIGIAFSGGVDSTFLAWFAKDKLGDSTTLFYANSPFISAREHENALRTAHWLGLRLEILDVDPLDSVEVRENPVDRCYFCKQEVFGRILARARELGIGTIADGSHAGDSGYRPGKKALAELGVISPLAKAGFDKDEIRLLSRNAGIPIWNKPSQSCLATRVPYGKRLTKELLAKIEKAEDYLVRLGCVQIRVRVHDDLARIEAAPTDFDLLVSPDIRLRVSGHLGELGFAHTTVDLAGFRSGSWDKIVGKK